MEVLVVPHNPSWQYEFAAEAKRICIAFGELPIAIHHIGSTAIHGIFAKPIIDILLVVRDLQAVDLKTEGMVALGYEAMGEFGIPGRRYFRKNTPHGVRTHHVHTFEQGSPDVQRHLVFRDYLNAHGAAAKAYSSLKQHLAASFPYDIEAYMKGKDSFIKEHEAKALEWQRQILHDA